MKITAFEYIIEAMPFESIEEKIIYAYQFCEKLNGCALYIPMKQHKKEIAKILIKGGIEKKKILETVGISKTTYFEIKKELDESPKTILDTDTY